MRDDRFSIDIPKRWLRRAVIAAAVGLLVLPAAAWAGHQFTDVPDDDSENGIFHDDIDWMAENEVTLGCNPPENTEYCPEEPVLRRQMAAFLHRMDTEDVFVTPDEADTMADAQTHFAVVDGTDGSVIASNDLDSADGAAGVYTLDFAAPISDCSWTGALGARDGSTIETDHTLTLNADADNDELIHVRIVDETNAAAEVDFNVTVNC